MKFYEFDEDFELYALIGANDIDSARCLYDDCIDEVLEDYPREINQEEAYNKLLNSCENNRQKRNEILNFRTHMQEDEPFLILIDGDLL